MTKTCFSLIALGAIAFAGSNSAVAQAADQSNSALAILRKHARSPQLAPALQEIVKLTKAGVAESVTLAFIQTSPTPYSLDAQDILQLRQQGVSAEVLTALMQHGEEVRQESQARQETEVAAAATAPVYHPPATTVASPAPVNTVSVTYFGSRDNSFPRYWGYRSGFTYGLGAYPGYYYYGGPRYYGYCGPQVGFGAGFGGVRYAGFYGGFGYCR